MFDHADRVGILVSLALFSPLAVPYPFLIYALVNRQFSLRMLFLFVSCEAVSLAFAARVLKWLVSNYAT